MRRGDPAGTGDPMGLEKDARMMRAIVVALCHLAVWTSAAWIQGSPVWAGTLTYQDGAGTIHIVDDPGKIPEPYRSEAAGTSGAGTLSTVGEGALGAAPEPGNGSRPLPGSEPEAPTGEPQTKACQVDLTAAPTIESDLKTQTVTVKGVVGNSGHGIARGVQVIWTLFRKLDGTVLAETRTLSSPNQLGPGERGSFVASIHLPGREFRQWTSPQSDSELLPSYLVLKVAEPGPAYRTEVRVADCY